GGGVGERRGGAGTAGQDLAGGDEPGQVEDVIHAALDGPVRAVAAVAVRFENGAGAGGEPSRGFGSVRQRGEEQQGKDGGDKRAARGTVHWSAPQAGGRRNGRIVPGRARIPYSSLL